MDFKIPETKRLSFKTKDYPYICTIVTQDKYLFSLQNEEVHNYLLIQNKIRKYHPRIGKKLVSYYIQKAVDTKRRYVSGYGLVSTYIYQPIIEVIRSKYEDEFYKDQLDIGLNIDIDESLKTPKPTRTTSEYTSWSTTASSTWINRISYQNANTTTTY